MNAPANLPRLEDLPIPDDVRVGRGWTPSMIEMADHIGAKAVLDLCEQLGGEVLSVPADPAKGRFAAVIGPEKSAILSHVYRRERVAIPTAKGAIAIARRGAVIAAVRAKRLTTADAARILRTTHRYVRRLVHEIGEGMDNAPVLPPPRRDSRQMDMFTDDL